MEKINLQDILKEMLKTGEDYQINEDLKVNWTYSEKSDDITDTKKMDVQMFVEGINFRRFSHDSTFGKDGFSCTDNGRTVEHYAKVIKAMYKVDTVMTGHGFEIPERENLVNLLDIPESKELQTTRVKSQLLDGILGRLEISKK